MISQQKAEHFIESLKGKISIGGDNKLVLNRKEIVDIFNSIK